MDLGQWLRSLGLQSYEQAFCDNAIDAAISPELTADDLKDLGVCLVGHRRKLLAAIAALRSDIVRDARRPRRARNGRDQEAGEEEQGGGQAPHG